MEFFSQVAQLLAVVTISTDDLRFIILNTFIALSGFSAVWNSPNTWNLEYEAKYQKWVKETLKKDIFTDPKSLYCQIDTDCADMIYTISIFFCSDC